MAGVPYDALGIRPEIAEYVEAPDGYGPSGLSTVIARSVLGRENTELVDALRDLAFDTEFQQGCRIDELDEHDRACLLRYCAALAGRLGLELMPGESNG